MRGPLGKVAAAVLFSTGFLVSSAKAHELAVDQFSFSVTPSGDELQGQLVFDPELTRKAPEIVSEQEAQVRVLAFVREQLVLTLDGARCTPTLEVRELYDESGATPGDMVSVSCRLSSGLVEHTLTARVGEDFGQLLLKGPSLQADGSQQILSELTLPGTSSPTFHFRSPSATSQNAHASGAREAVAQSEQVDKSLPKDSLRPWYEVLASWIKVGFLHILPLGWDHVLFVLGVVLGTRSFRQVMIELTGFTVAHSLTLALATGGVLFVNHAWVEPAIALSIALLGVETLVLRRDKIREKFRRQRMLLVFGFGLVHGLGFAGAFKETAPELGSFTLALLGFNLGVECGQAVVALNACALLLLLEHWPEKQKLFLQVSSALLICTGLYWATSRSLIAYL